MGGPLLQRQTRAETVASILMSSLVPMQYQSIGIERDVELITANLLYCIKHNSTIRTQYKSKHLILILNRYWKDPTPDFIYIEWSYGYTLHNKC